MLWKATIQVRQELLPGLKTQTHRQVCYQPRIIQRVIAIVEVAIKLRLDTRLSEDRRMVSPRRVRDINQLVAFVQLADGLGCNFDAATATYALRSREEKSKNKFSRAVNFKFFSLSRT